MRVKVEAYAGYMAHERPIRFTLGGRCIEVKDIIDRWYGEAERYFRVSTNDGDVYVLKYSDREDAWELVSFTDRSSRGTDPRGAIDKTLH